MPKENKHARGRRDAWKEKRKRPDEEIDGYTTKRQRSMDANEIAFQRTDNTEEFADDGKGEELIERPFFGLLNDEEQEYFRRADELLELNDFPSDEERTLFLENVYKEAEGKELKIANSQSSSRLMERLILLSTANQKKKLFEKFSGHFLHLIQHRFASHCCETLFIHSAPVVTQELTADITEGQTGGLNGEQNGEYVYVSMENLFLYTLNELEGHMNFLLTDKFASHALRVLLVVLSGQPLEKASTKSLLQSKRKEQIGVTGLESGTAEFSIQKRAVPESFDFAVSKIISDVAAGLDITFIHVLATHPTGNPTLQLLLELELTAQSKHKPSTENQSIVQKLLPDDSSLENSKSASFINGLIYDPIGSRLLETIVTFTPGKLFKQIYRTTFKERIASLARNEVASFVVIKVLERLSKQDLEEAVTFIIPQIPSLVERHRTTIIKTLLERCSVRGATASIALLTTAIEEAYGSDASSLLLKMTNTTSQSLAITAGTEASKSTRTDSSTIHGSLLAQTMLSIPGPPSTLLQASILPLSPQTLLHLSCTTSMSHILQAALQPTSTNLSFRRKLINALLNPRPAPPPSTDTPSPPAPLSTILTLATSKPGSHVLDALWAGTTGLMMLKERICTALLAHDADLRNDFTGRVVLRNWMVELFGRRKAEWVRRVRAGEEEGGSGGVAARKDHGGPGRGRTGGASNGDGSKRAGGAPPRGGRGQEPGRGKTAIELAREKFAIAKARKGNQRIGRILSADIT